MSRSVWNNEKQAVVVWVWNNKAIGNMNRGADKSLAQQWRKQATATEDFDFHVSYL